MPDSLLGKIGFSLLLLVLALAPAIGGFPAGPTYGADVALNALRCLTLVAGILLFLEKKEDATTLQASTSAPQVGAGLSLFLRISLFSLLFAILWTVVSLLVHSQFLTSPVLLFAMLPGTLDWVCFGIVFTQCLRQGRNSQSLFLLLAALLIGAAWASFRSVQEFGQLVQQGFPGQRAQGAFFSPNFAAGLMALLLPVVVAWCVGTRERLLPVVLGALVAMMTGALFASGSRAGIAFTIVGLFVALLLSLPHLTKRGTGTALPSPTWIRIAVLLLVFVAAGFAFRGPIVRRTETSGQEQSGDFRAWTAKGTLRMAQANPILGTGPGTFPYSYPRYTLVARTDLAHTSYLQLAAEQGFPALIAVGLSLLAIVMSGASQLIRPDKSSLPTGSEEVVVFLLKAGLLGGLLAGMARNLVDSEWSILGDALPFWAVAGLVASPLPVAAVAVVVPTVRKWGKSAPTKTLAPLSVAASVALVPALILAFLCLRTAQVQGTYQATLQNKQPLPDATETWPPDPQVLYIVNRPDEAARIEPTGRRFYQLARVRERDGDINGAIEALQKSVAVEPTALQTWRRLAETYQAAGNTTEARKAWENLMQQHEGPVGQIRAIPEMTETHPAFAYAALARAAKAKNETERAIAFYEKAATVIEEYSRMTPLYQQTEVITALTLGTNLLARRQEVRSLYEAVIAEWSQLQPERASELTARRDETLARLDKFVTPDSAPVTDSER